MKNSSIFIIISERYDQSKSILLDNIKKKPVGQTTDNNHCINFATVFAHSPSPSSPFFLIYSRHIDITVVNDKINNNEA